MIVEHSAGKPALSEYRVRERFQNATLLEVILHTGRTHQIRVHMAYLGYPVIGDSVYGVTSPLISRQALHARVIAFCHPRLHKRVSFTAEIPDDLKRLFTSLQTKGD